MRASYRLYPIIAVALLAAASVWLERLSREPEAAPVSGMRNAPDFVAEQTRIVGFGKDGSQRYSLIAERMTHYPDTDITLVDQPRIELSSGARDMKIRAEHGEVSPGGERIDFSGKVEALREGDSGEPATTFVSERLSVWPDDHRAETTAPVVLTRGTTTARANGLQANELFGTLVLAGQARVTIPRRKGNTQ